MKWMLFVFPVLAVAQQAEPKILPKIELFPPGGIHSMIPSQKRTLTNPVPAPKQADTGQCSIPLVNVTPPRQDGVIMIVPQDRTVTMPQFAVPAPPCSK